PEPPGHGDANGPAVGGETSGRAADLQEAPEAVGARANGTGDARRERGLCRPAALAGRQGSTDGVPREAKAGLHEVEGAGDGKIDSSDSTNAEGHCEDSRGVLRMRLRDARGRR